MTKANYDAILKKMVKKVKTQLKDPSSFVSDEDIYKNIRKAKKGD